MRCQSFENGNCPQAVVMVPGVFELNMSGKPQMQSTNSDADPHRKNLMDHRR